MLSLGYTGLVYIGLVDIGNEDSAIAGYHVHGEIYPSSTLIQ